MKGRHDWYRNTSWTESERDEFETRLSRARKTSRSQYLSIQAWHLLESGLFWESLSLIDRMLDDYPDRLNLSSGYLIRAKGHEALGNFEKATQSFRMSIQTERDFPNVRTNVQLDFAQFAVANDLEDLFFEALSVLDEFQPVGTQFPAHEYLHYALKSCLLHALKLNGATSNVELARKAAEKKHSGFRNHPTLCLVEEEPDWLRTRLDRIIAG